MIKIEYVGEFGNNLFTYTYSRIMAERHGIALLSNLPEHGYITNTENKKGNIYNTPPVVISDRDNPYFKTPDFSEKKTFLVNGFFQDIQYYTDREYITTFFNLPIIEPNEDDVVLHVRLSDYKNFGKLGTILNPDYYLRALKKVTYRNLYIVTDEPDNDVYFSTFDGLSPTIISKSSEHDFKFLMKFKKIIIGNSTFSWWAAFLGAASEVYSPSVWMRYCTHIRDLNKIKDSTIIEATWI